MKPPSPPGIIAVYGFLGSGKTTVMLQLARQIVSTGRKAAIVVNEAGEVPIDGKVLEVAGLPVKEIFAGCICCSLVGHFVDTLRALLKAPELDCILIEPSGMADARSLFDALNKYVSRDFVRLLIVDGPRLSLLLKAAGNLIAGQVRAAGLILLNKVDALNSKELEEAQSLLAELPHDADIYEVIGKNPLPESLIGKILRWNT